MGFLDKVKDTAKQVGDKAQQGVKAGQEKLDDAKTKKKIESLKEELGGVVYQQRTGAASGDPEAEITRLVGEIKAAQDTLDADDAGATEETDE